MTAFEESQSLQRDSLTLRREIIRALHASGGGHYGGCMSVLDILNVILSLYVHPNRERSVAADRDRVILSKGHAALAYYAVLGKLGLIEAKLDTYASFGSPLEGHPDSTVNPAVDFSTGSLGQGLSVGVGMAIGLRSLGCLVWVVLGDGECQEGQIWEAAMLAARYGLDNLIAVVDMNKYQEYGWSSHPDAEHADPISNPHDKWASFGWSIIHCDGHSYPELIEAFESASERRGKPTVVLAATIKGKGLALLESDPNRFHCDVVSEEEHREMLEELGEC